MPPDSLTIARKHVEISIKCRKLARDSRESCAVYLASHWVGKPGQSFRKIEQQSGEEFWGIKAWTLPPRRRLKDPDVIMTQDKRVKVIIEVKWGSVPGRATSDLGMSQKEWDKIARLLGADAMCRVSGPVVKDGLRYQTGEFQIKRDYFTDGKTKLVLVSDFCGVKQALGIKLDEFIESWKAVNDSRLLIADISTRVGDIPSWQEVLEQIV